VHVHGGGLHDAVEDPYPRLARNDSRSVLELGVALWHRSGRFGQPMTG
jgi:hypothetical protein